MADSARKKSDLSGLKGLAGVMSGEAAIQARTFRQIPRDRIAPDVNQPRKVFPEESLAELAASIEANGIMTPLVVRENPDQDGHYILIAGERRWRASERAGLNELPAVVRTDWHDADALLENLQREDLSALDTANAVQRLLVDGNMTSAALARQLGKNKDWVSLYKQVAEAGDDLKTLYTDGILTDARAVVELARARAKLGEPINTYIASLPIGGEPVTRRELRRALDAIEHDINAETQRPAPAHKTDGLTAGKGGSLDTPAGDAAPSATRPDNEQQSTDVEQPESPAKPPTPPARDEQNDSVDEAPVWPDVTVRVTWREDDGPYAGVIIDGVEDNAFKVSIYGDEGQWHQVDLSSLRITGVARR